MNKEAEKAGEVYAVIVSFEPDLVKLNALLQSVSAQVGGVVVVDNGSSSLIVSWLEEYNLGLPYCVIALGENRGVAFAQNEGISFARRAGADYVILFDHDSLPAADMVALLLFATKTKVSEGCKVAAVGPRYLDARQNNPPPFIELVGLKMIRKSCYDGNKIVEVDYIISSGSLISLEIIDIVGGMRNELFVDYIDIEWGLRARSKGFQSFGVCCARMQHYLGDEPIKFFKKEYPSHSPLRHYYIFRNAIWMYRQSWLSARWKLVDGWRLLLKYGFYSVFAKPRRMHWWMMTKGVLHGLVGKMGKLD